MNFLELALQRSSVRDYQPKAVEREKLLQVLEAARIAPSAANFQPWQFVVFTDFFNQLRDGAWVGNTLS